MIALNSREHYNLMDQFEIQNRGLRLDREQRALWPRGIIYQNGEVNSLFLAFRKGYALGKSLCLTEAVK